MLIGCYGYFGMFFKSCQKITNIYGQGSAADVIVRALENSSVGLTKQFRDM